MATVDDTTENAGAVNKEEPLGAEDPAREAKIIKYNWIACVVHLLQAIIMFAAGVSVTNFKNFKLPVTLNYLTQVDKIGQPGEYYLATTAKNIGNVHIAPLVSIFFFLSALFHYLVVSPCFKEKYLTGLREGRNTFRWIEYSISSSLMIWLIAQLFGVADISLLIAIFVMNAVMNLQGLQMETSNPSPRDDSTPVDWFPFILGTILGATTWLIVFIYFFGSGPSKNIPGFVYGVLFSYLLFFNTFPINMVLVYKRVGKWKDYMFGEFIYIVLSLASKTLLGWLVFGGVNQPNQYT